MSSMFDGLTVSAPALGADEPGPYSGRPASLPSVLPASPSAVSQGGSIAATGPTGLIARVEPEEFVKLVTQAGPIVVLYTPQTKATTQRMGNDRYVASVSGIVMITHSGSALRFPSNVRVVSASAVLCNGRPLSNEDFV